MNIVLIDNGKTPDEPLSGRHTFWLPPNSPYGNFTLKLFKLVQRLDEANRRINESWAFWAAAASQDVVPNVWERHYYATEQAIYLMRRATDEIIALIWCLSEKDKTGTYPSQVEVDCIGAVLGQKDHEKMSLFLRHNELLTHLNEVSNAYKHSFVNTDLNLIGAEEPVVYTLSLKRNMLSANVQFQGVSLSAFVNAFNAFYKDSLIWLRAFSVRNHPNAGI